MRHLAKLFIIPILALPASAAVITGASAQCYKCLNNHCASGSGYRQCYTIAPPQVGCVMSGLNCRGTTLSAISEDKKIRIVSHTPCSTVTRPTKI